MKATKAPAEASRITAPKIPEDTNLRFSFKLLDIQNNKKFALHHTAKGGYWEKLLLRLKDVSGIRIKEFRQNYSKQLRNHRIDFSKTSEPNGFSQLNEQLRGEEAWQFELTQNEHGRVHGLLMGDTFYIVWLDPCHILYSGDDTCHKPEG
jgi:hypothetical protein